MSELLPSTGELWADLLIIATGISGGGAAVALIKWLRDWMIQRREQYIDISKTKIKTISKSLPYYSQIASYSFEISYELKSNKLDYILILYYICKILNLKEECLRIFGTIQIFLIVWENMMLTGRRRSV